MVITAGRQTQVREIQSGGTYLSQSDLRVYLGLGSYAGRVDVEVVLPGGGRWIANGLEPDRLTSLMLRERDQIKKRTKPARYKRLQAVQPRRIGYR